MYSHSHPPLPQQGSTAGDAYPWTYDPSPHQQRNGHEPHATYANPHSAGPSTSHQQLPLPPPLPDYRTQTHDSFAHYSLNPNHQHHHPSSAPASSNVTPTSQHQGTPGTKYAEAPFYPFGDLEPPHSSSLHLSVPPINPFDDGHGGFGTLPDPAVVPPLPMDMGRALSDAALAQLDHPNPFSLVDVGPHSSVAPWASGSGPPNAQDRPLDQGHALADSNPTSNPNSNSNTFKFDHYEVLASLLSTRPDAAQAQTQTQTPGSEASPFTFPTGQSTPTTGMSPSLSGVAMGSGTGSSIGAGLNHRKAIERKGEWHLDLGRDLKRVRAEGHNEFDKDIALVRGSDNGVDAECVAQACADPAAPDISHRAGGTAPAVRPAHASPQKPPPFLHTRFLRLTSSVQQTLANLAPASHTYLASEFTSAPPGNGQADTKATTKAEKEMEIIRKRRDMLIAKAAQAKATQAAQALAGGFTSGATSHNRSGTATSSSASPGVFHPTVPNPLAHPPPHTYPNVSSGLASYAIDANGSTRINGSGAETGYNGLGRPAPIHPDNPTGRCHSCGISVTMEWRKGPDGARTLCDSCGTHYAKLARRRSSASPTKIPESLFG